MRNLALLALILALSACGTTQRLTTSDLQRPIPKGNSRLIFERDNSYQSLMLDAAVSVNGEKVASVAHGSEALADVKAGHLALTVTVAGDFGDYTTTLDAAAGKTYRFLITKGDDHPMFPALLAGGVGDQIYAANHRNAGSLKLARVK